MKFRPCIDIHNGKVKQIVGGSLTDKDDYAKENFVSNMSAKDYAALYRRHNIFGGHIILLNGKDSEYYEENLFQAKEALNEFPGGLQIGGGITDKNAKSFIEMGASHIIVTSFVFIDGKIRIDRLERLVNVVGKKNIVLDLSCKKKNGSYYIATNRWQKITNQSLNGNLLLKLSEYCNEFLIHAVDVEGTATGPEKELLSILAENVDLPITYAGGIGSMEDLEILKTLGKGKIDFTIGSALDLFGGHILFDEIVTKY